MLKVQGGRKMEEVIKVVLQLKKYDIDKFRELLEFLRVKVKEQV